MEQLKQLATDKNNKVVNNEMIKKHGKQNSNPNIRK